LVYDDGIEESFASDQLYFVFGKSGELGAEHLAEFLSAIGQTFLFQDLHERKGMKMR